MPAIKEMFYKHISPSKFISKFDGFGSSKENQEDLQNEIPNELNLLEKPVSILKGAGSPASSYASCKSALTPKSVRFSDLSSPYDSEEDEKAVNGQASLNPMIPKKPSIDLSNMNEIEKARHLLRSVSPKLHQPASRRHHELPRNSNLFQDSDDTSLSDDSTQPNSPVTVLSSSWESIAAGNKLDTRVSMSPSIPLNTTDAQTSLSGRHLDSRCRVSLEENEVTVTGQATPPPPRYVYIPARPFSPLSLLDKKAAARQRIPESISSKEWCSTPTIYPVLGLNEVNKALKGDSQVVSTSIDEETSTDDEELWTQKLSTRRFRRSARISKRVHFPNAEVFAEEYAKVFDYEDPNHSEFKIQ